jgi:hypothetical protein
LYGSRKPNHERYKLTSIYEVSYDVTDGEFMRNEIPLVKYDVVANINELSVRNPNNLSLFMKSGFMTAYNEYKRIHRIGGGSNTANAARPVNTNQGHTDFFDGNNSITQFSFSTFIPY